MPVNFCLEVSGDFACFTRPEMKVERVSYDVITPSSARAIFEAILWKPAMHWGVTKIEVLNPVKWISIRRNEVSKVASTPTSKQIIGRAVESFGIYVDDSNTRQQRAGLFLRDVKYRIHADLHFDQSQDIEAEYGKYAAMFERRARKGQCFNQPYLGCREFSCKFRFVSKDELPLEAPPIAESRPLGWMLYDLDYSNSQSPAPRFFNASLKNGTITIPEWESEEVKG